MNYPSSTNYGYATVQTAAGHHLPTPTVSCNLCSQFGHTAEACYTLSLQTTPNWTSIQAQFSSQTALGAPQSLQYSSQDGVISGYQRQIVPVDQPKFKVPKHKANLKSFRHTSESDDPTSDFPSVPRFSLNKSLLNSPLVVNGVEKVPSTNTPWPSYLSSFPSTIPTPTEILAAHYGTSSQSSGFSPLPSSNSSTFTGVLPVLPPDIHTTVDPEDEVYVTHFEEAWWADALSPPNQT